MCNQNQWTEVTVCVSKPLWTQEFIFTQHLISPKSFFSHLWSQGAGVSSCPFFLSGTFNLCCCPSLAILLGRSSYTQNFKLIWRDVTQQMNWSSQALGSSPAQTWTGAQWHCTQSRLHQELAAGPYIPSSVFQSQIKPRCSHSNCFHQGRNPHQRHCRGNCIPISHLLLLSSEGSFLASNSCTPPQWPPRLHRKDTQKYLMQPSPFWKLTTVDKFPARHFSTKLQPMSLLALLTQVP